MYIFYYNKKIYFVFSIKDIFYFMLYKCPSKLHFRTFIQSATKNCQRFFINPLFPLNDFAVSLPLLQRIFLQRYI